MSLVYRRFRHHRTNLPSNLSLHLSFTVFCFVYAPVNYSITLPEYILTLKQPSSLHLSVANKANFEMFKTFYVYCQWEKQAQERRRKRCRDRQQQNNEWTSTAQENTSPPTGRLLRLMAGEGESWMSYHDIQSRSFQVEVWYGTGAVDLLKIWSWKQRRAQYGCKIERRHFVALLIFRYSARKTQMRKRDQSIRNESEWRVHYLCKWKIKCFSVLKWAGGSSLIASRIRSIRRASSGSSVHQTHELISRWHFTVWACEKNNGILLAAAMMDGYTWKAINGIGSSRKYSFNTPATTLMSSQDDESKFVFDPSVNQWRSFKWPSMNWREKKDYLCQMPFSGLPLHRGVPTLDKFLPSTILAFQLPECTCQRWTEDECRGLWSTWLNQRQRRHGVVSNLDNNQQESFPNISCAQWSHNLKKLKTLRRWSY